MRRSGEKRCPARNIGTLACLVFVGAIVLAPFIMTGQTQQKPAEVAGTWHVAIPGWKIEDHMLVLQQDGRMIGGRFEFADVRGTISANKIAFAVSSKSYKTEIATFQGTVSGETMKGTVTKSKDSPLPGRAGTTGWTARRGEYK